MIVEIDCDKVPKTGENFIELCEKKYFNNVSFHRLIKNFMVNQIIFNAFRFKVEILMEQEEADNLILDRDLKMNITHY